MKKRSVWILFVSLFILSIALTACGSDNNSSEGNQQEPGEQAADTGEGDAASSDDVVEIVIKASNWEFDNEVYEVPQGATVHVTLENEAGYHEATIDGYSVEVKQNETTTFVADQTGEFTIACSIMCGAKEDHDNMTAKLVVQ